MTQPISKSSKTTKIKSIVTLIGLSILLSLGIIELFFYLNPSMLPRVIQSRYFLSDATWSPPGAVIDTDIGYRYLPDIELNIPFGDSSYSFSTVSLDYDDIGFRDDGITGTPDNIVLGDSMVVCTGVDIENCWVELLEQQIDQDFINLGVSGFGPDLQYRMLKKYGLPLNPKKVLWVIFPNDSIQAWRFNKFGQGGVKGGEFWKNPIPSWLAKHSTIYITIAYFWYERNFFRNVYFGDPPVANNITLSWWLAYTDSSVPEVAEGLARTQSILLEAYQDTVAHQAEFIVVILPFREQVLYKESEFQPIFDSTAQAIVDFGQVNNITVIDLTQPIIEMTTQSPDTFFFTDSHLTVEGNKLVSDILAEELKTMAGSTIDQP